LCYRSKIRVKALLPKELAHIRERFYRTENTRNKSGSGSGLGLAIVKELTEAMGGRVAASSVVSEGTCFSASPYQFGKNIR